MKNNDIYLVIKFAKKEADELYKDVYFESVCADFGRINSENRFVSLETGEELEFIEAYQDCTKSQKSSFYAFPLLVSYLDLMTLPLDRVKKSMASKYYKHAENMVVFPEVFNKDGQEYRTFTCISIDNNMFFPELGQSLIDPKNEIRLDTNATRVSNLTRKEIIKYIKDRVLYQDEQIETLVDAVMSNQKYYDYETLKENLLIIGLTGTGKTEMVSTLAKLLNIPYVKADATKYTTTGYVGKSVVDMLRALYIKAECDVTKAEQGIIIIDEFDKLGDKNNSQSGVRSTDVQEELLGLTECGEYSFEFNGKEVTINTSKITFVFMGAFQNVFKSICDSNRSIGFNSDIDKNIVNNKNITRDQLVDIGGIKSELIGRIPIIIQTNPLDKKAMKEIATTSKISNLRIWQQAFFKEDNVVLVVTDEALDMIASKSSDLNIGARGLKSVMSSVLRKIRSDVLDGNLNDNEITITKDTIENPSKYLVKKIKKGYGNNELSKRVGEDYI